MLDTRRRVLYRLTPAFALMVIVGGGVLARPIPRVSADAPVTPTPTLVANPIVSPELTGTSTPTATATPTPEPTATPRPPIVPTRESSAKKHRARPPRITATPTATPRPARERPRRSHSRRKRRRAHAKPSATPTPTPALNLNTEDSVSPVTCNGPPTAPAKKPFLRPPYHGWTSIVSFMDHDSPNFVRDGLVLIANGMQATPDGLHTRSDFPAYWNPSVRQYLYYDGHNGYDFNLWYQPVYASAAGKVIFAAYEYPDMPDHGYGKMVMIEHRGGYVTLYGHISKILVRKGQKVRRGQKIGISGNTGHSTGPHLHFTVFHNCTPTDPYGWTGQGPDPLASYQGESSIDLWSHFPLVVNPPPAWPGVAASPAPPTERIALLRLPPGASGTRQFTADLRRVALKARAQLAGPGVSIKIDLLRGALLILGPITPRNIYLSPLVASISSPDTILGAKTDVLAALARAALSMRHSQSHLGRSRRWTGYLLRWQGRTLLIGRGALGARVDLRLSGGRGGDVVRGVETDPHTGAYVVDLGQLSSGQYRRLMKELEHRSRGGSPAGIEPVRTRSSGPPRRSSGTAAACVAIIGAIMAAILLAAVTIRLKPWEKFRPREAA